jgi:hypothetical protein
MRQRSADLTGADQRNFVSRHRRKFLDWLRPPTAAVLSPFGRHVQAASMSSGSETVLMVVGRLATAPRRSQLLPPFS